VTTSVESGVVVKDVEGLSAATASVGLRVVVEDVKGLSNIIMQRGFLGY
jgi:hypothetical protein